MPNEIDQIRALLAGDAHRLVAETLAKDKLELGDYESVISVEHETVVDFLTQFSGLEKIADSTPSQRDGFYAVPRDNGWDVYIQERGCKLQTAYARSSLGVFTFFVEHYLGLRPKGKV